MSRTTGLVFSVVLILAISGPHSSLQAQNNGSVPEALGGFKAAEPPKPVPTVGFVDGDEGARTLADYRGRGVVLNFWATWCAPCVKEMPDLDRLQTIIEKDGIAVLAMSVDRGAAALVRKFYRVNKLENLPVLRDPEGKLMRRMAVRGLPTTILIDAEGREVGRVVGPAEWDRPDVAAFLRRRLGPKRRPE